MNIVGTKTFTLNKHKSQRKNFDFECIFLYPDKNKNDRKPAMNNEEDGRDLESVFVAHSSV